MDKKTEGAWLLSQSKNLDGVTGAGAAQLENIAYAGRIGRLYNLLRRNIPGEPSPTIDKETVLRACQLNGIDRPTRERGLQVLVNSGRVDVAKNGGVTVLGATAMAVLELTSDVFTDSDPSGEERAVLDLSEQVATSPMGTEDAIEKIGDEHEIDSDRVRLLIDLCRRTALIDEVQDRGRSILFNSNTFRDGKYAVKAMEVLKTLSATDQQNLNEVHSKLSNAGALYEGDVRKILGAELFRKLIAVGYFDRMEVSNSTEAVGYIASPNDFQKYGRPFEDDPIDDAKALLASLTYGRTRSGYTRGAIAFPVALLNALIAGREVGKNGIRAIGEDYRELEARQVVKVIEKSPGRYTMKLLKKDVGELALTIVQGGGGGAEEALLLDGSAASGFIGPHASRMKVREKNTINDVRFMTDALDKLRAGG